MQKKENVIRWGRLRLDDSLKGSALPADPKKLKKQKNMTKHVLSKTR